jgi:hypothetical protein
LISRGLTLLVNVGVMKSSLPVLLAGLFSLGTVTQAQARPFQLRCLAAGGYYGTARALEQPDGRILVLAAQGLHHDLAQGSGLGGFSFQFEFRPGQCQFAANSPDAIRCQGRVRAKRSHYPGEGNPAQTISFIADASFSAVPARQGQRQGHLVRASVKNDANGSIGRASYFFDRMPQLEREGCNLR